jgi:hypothetical protein
MIEENNCSGSDSSENHSKPERPAGSHSTTRHDGLDYSDLRVLINQTRPNADDQKIPKTTDQTPPKGTKR